MMANGFMPRLLSIAVGVGKSALFAGPDGHSACKLNGIQTLSVREPLIFQ
jgi:hypothetical protein